MAQIVPGGEANPKKWLPSGHIFKPPPGLSPKYASAPNGWILDTFPWLKIIILRLTIRRD